MLLFHFLNLFIVGKIYDSKENYPCPWWTGNQGGSVVNALLKNPEKWNIRVLSRNPQSEKAIALQQCGCQIVKGDFDQHDELVKSLEGVDFVFLLTNFWQPPYTKEAEIAQGKKFADAVVEAKQCKLKAIVFSSQPHANQISNGKINVEHVDSKTEIEKYLKDLKLPFISVGLSYYMKNFESQFCPLQKLEKPDEYLLTYPMKPMDRLPFVDIAEYGIVVVSVFENFKEYLGKTLYVISESITVQNIAQTLQEVTGFKIQLSHLTPESYAKLPIPFAVELAEMYRFLSLYPESFEGDVDVVKMFISKPTTWKEYVEKTWKDWTIFK